MVEAFEQADCVVAEDTRRTRALLSHLGVERKPLLALNAHASASDVARVASRVEAGQRVVYATDAGTPGVSDPGRALVAGMAERGLPVSCLPGASAVTGAVALSALVEGPFLFLGFLPRKGAARATVVERMLHASEPVVFFESPRRAADTLAELAVQMPERQAFVGRELTKLHEELLWAPLSELAAPTREWRGEIVMVLAAAPVLSDNHREVALVEAVLEAAVGSGASPSRVSRALADAMGISRRELYQRALELAERHQVRRSESD